MLGCMRHDSAKFWVRTAQPANVKVVVEPESNDSNKISRHSATAKSDSETDFTAIIEVAGLKPDSSWKYKVFVDNEPEPTLDSYRFRTYPAPNKPTRFQIAFGGGALYNPENERMWDLLANRNLAGCYLLGDNVYIDLPEQAGPLHDYTYYRRQSRPEFRRLVASTPIYSIWDDHDCAIDDCFMGPYVDKPNWKHSMWKLFRNNWNNPDYGAAPKWPGCWFKTSIANVDFFFLDGRYYRTHPQSPDASMLGQEQKQWLFEELKNSQAIFKVIISPVPFADGAKAALDTWRGYPKERAEIFKFLSSNQIEGIILVTADRHRSDAWRLDRDDDYPLFEFQSSCLTHDKLNFAPLMPGALFGYNKKCSFGLLTFDTTKLDPELTYEIVTIDNVPVHQLQLKRSQLGRGQDF